ncbi:MAG: hypothetical protein M1816_003371 [Peltula sp. TS41687]|nr:MAG: hypothetical protein M1816_003371 [Peltula sp. TS41687]
MLLNCMDFSAGVRDSALSNHGVLQTQHLGESFRSKGVLFTNVFSSDLQRAFKTAEAIRIAQPEDRREASPVRVVQIPLLREKNFGSLEGKHVLSSSSGSLKRKVSVKEVKNPLEEKDDGDFEDVESQESMIARVDEFLDKYLLKLLDEDISAVEEVIEEVLAADEKVVRKEVFSDEKVVGKEVFSDEKVVAIVSHGITLTVLWKGLLSRLTSTNITAAPDIPLRPGGTLEHLGFWSNTGYLELDLTRQRSSRPPSDTDLNVDPADVKDVTVEPSHLQNCYLTIRAINERGHLATLKRTGGGVGSSKHDSDQQKIERFFKKQKVE